MSQSLQSTCATTKQATEGTELMTCAG